jgi:dipeptidyl aminopeptidase/acylaminoacyl peptidase
VERAHRGWPGEANNELQSEIDNRKPSARGGSEKAGHGPSPRRASFGRAVLAAGLATTLLTSGAWAQRKTFTPGDLWLWRTISETRISPDGRWVVYTENWNDRAANAVYQNLWLASADGRERHQLTDGAWRDWSPRWSANSDAMAYISNRTGSAQIRIRRVESGQDSQLGQLAQGPLALTWSPAGDALAFTAPVVARPSAAWAPEAILRFLKPPPVHPQLFVIPLSGADLSGATTPGATTPGATAPGAAARQITTGDLNWLGEPAWMPNGQSILCEAASDPDPEHPLEGGEIFSVRPADGAMKQMTQHEGPDEQPTPSPDGSRIAWVSADAKAQSYVVRNLYVMNPDGSRIKLLTGGFDRDVVKPQWSSDSRTIYFLAEDRGAAHVYLARLDGTVHPVTKGQERLRDFSLADNGRAAAIRSSATEGGDAISFAADLPGGVTTLAAPNEHLLAERQIAAMEEIHYDSGGHTIQGWIVKPAGFDPSVKYPLLVDIQDNPRAMYGYEFQLRAQILAAAGYALLLANPRGSPGYGEEFGSLLRTRYPGDDADDLLRGVDYAVTRGFIDAKHLAVSGGLVAAWIIGHTDRFSAAVLRDPIADWLIDIATRPDGLRRAASWMGAMPWDEPDQYVKHSPVYFARNFQTPTLVLGDGPGADEMDFALRARKVDSALVRLPAAGGLAVNVLELEAELGWIGRKR